MQLSLVQRGGSGVVVKSVEITAGTRQKKKSIEVKLEAAALCASQFFLLFAAGGL